MSARCPDPEKLFQLSTCSYQRVHMKHPCSRLARSESIRFTTAPRRDHAGVPRRRRGSAGEDPRDHRRGQARHLRGSLRAELRLPEGQAKRRRSVRADGRRLHLGANGVPRFVAVISTFGARRSPSTTSRIFPCFEHRTSLSSLGASSFATTSPFTTPRTSRWPRASSARC